MHQVCRVYFYIFTTLLPHLYYTFSAPSLHFWIMLLSWYSKPSQQQWIISGLKTNFNPSPSYSARKSSNHKFSTSTKSVLTQIFKKRRRRTHANIKLSFGRINPFGIAPVEKKSTQDKFFHFFRCSFM